MNQKQSAILLYIKVLLFGLFLAVIFSKILLINPSEQIIGDGGDNFEFFGFQYLVKENILEGKHPFAWTNTLRYPVGFDLSVGYDGALAVFTGALLGFLIPQTVAYNTTIIIILFLNFFCSYIFLKSVSKNLWVQLIGSMVYGFSPYVFARIQSHLNLAFVGGFPLLAFVCLRVWRHISRHNTVTLWDCILMAIGLLAVAFGSLQYLMLLIEILIPMVLIGIVLSSTRAYMLQFVKVVLLHWKRVLAAGALFIVVFLFFYGGYVSNIPKIISVSHKKYQSYGECCKPQLADIVIPNSYLGNWWGLMNQSPPSIEKVVSLGIVAWVLVIIAFIHIRRNRSKLLGLAVVFSFVILSIDLIGFPLIPEGGRSVVLFSIFTTFVIVKFLETKSRSFLIAVFGLLILERLSFTVQISEGIPSEIAEIVKQQEGEAVFTIPLSKYDGFKSALPYVFGKKVVDGYFHYTAENAQSSAFVDHPLIGRFICDAEKATIDTSTYSQIDALRTYQLLKNNGIKTIVVFYTLSNQRFYHDGCSNVRDAWYTLRPPSIVIPDSTISVAAQSLELTFQSRVNATIYFARPGEFNFIGLLLYPSLLTDTLVSFQDGTSVFPEWTVGDEGLTTTFDPVVTRSVGAGETITISSPSKVNEPVYLTLFYSFTPVKTTVVYPQRIEPMYEGKDYGVYKIN